MTSRLGTNGLTWASKTLKGPTLLALSHLSEIHWWHFGFLRIWATLVSVGAFQLSLFSFCPIISWCELILSCTFYELHFVYGFWFLSRKWWETQRRFPLDTNLTKWLSKCEGSLLEGKEKTQLYGDDDEEVQN